MTRIKIIAAVALLGLACSIDTAKLQGQQFDMSWYKIAGGGGYTAGGNFELEGTIGQHDAGPPMSGGQFTVTGGFGVGSELQGPITIAPDSFLVTRGTYVAGGITELATSDNADFSIRRAISDIQSRTEFEAKSISPFANPTTIDVTLEGAVFARSEVIQTIELYDYVAGDWELLVSQPANRFSDITVTVAAAGDLTRFVEAGTNCMEARIRYQSTNPRQQFVSHTDQVVWTIGE